VLSTSGEDGTRKKVGINAPPYIKITTLKTTT